MKVTLAATTISTNDMPELPAAAPLKLVGSRGRLVNDCLAEALEACFSLCASLGFIL